ncbi:secreted protein [Cryptosporidium xiaoi]|uniref:Secreted protein n=1 Tax=Cryptosporidium xiaoi TaxID=659607 RepID=A0AAV9XSV7_9CRYT
MRLNQHLLIVVISLICIFSVYCSESSELQDEGLVILERNSVLNDLSSSVVEGASESYIYVDEDSRNSGANLEYIIVEQRPQTFGGLIAPPTQPLLPQGGFQLGGMSLQTGQIQQTPVIGRDIAFGDGNKIQWIGGPVDFESMVDCKFYRQNPGFCVPMSIYTPCSRCKAGVRTIFRTSYRVRCPGKDSFPPQLRAYFVWVPTSHRNPKRERGIFSRWRRQFMCIVMAVSAVPSDLSQFWQHSQISLGQQPEQTPHLLSPYTQQTAFGYGNYQPALQYYTTVDDSDEPSSYYILN